MKKLTEKVLKQMKWYDVPLLKLSVFFFTLFLVTVWYGFRNIVLGIEWYWFLILGCIVMLPLVKKMFTK